MVAITFSGVGSGLDYATWVEQLVEIRQTQNIAPLQTQQSELQTKNSTLSKLKSNFSSLLTSIQTITDANNFNKWESKGENIVDVSDKSRLNATVTSSTPQGIYNLEINQIATPTNFFGTNDLITSETSKNTKLSEIFGSVAGNVNINGVQIEITDETTIDEFTSLISESEAGLNVEFKQGQLNFKAKNTGDDYVNISEDTTGIFNKLGLLNQDGIMIEDKQNLGVNAKIAINGKNFETKSNSIDQSTTNVAGLNLELKKATVIGSTVTVEVKSDIDDLSDTVKSAVKDLVSAYNVAINAAKTETSESGNLRYDTQLNTIISSLRTSSVASLGTSGDYTTLYQLGISTGDIGAGVDADTTSIKLDETKLGEAWENDPESVKDLLFKLGDALNEIVKQAVDPTYGYFATKTTSNDSQLTRLASKIERETTNLTAYQELLTKQFQAMDTQISKMQKAFNSSSLFSGS